jgi:hypothetical protein
MSKPNERIPLRQGIAERFAAVELDAAQLHQLRFAAAQDLPQRPERRRWLGAAAVLVAAAGLGLLATRRGPQEDNLALLADEVAANHLAYRTVDVAGSSIAALRPAFASLGFALLDAPADPALEGAELLGGRFCSIASVPAVQLRYRAATGDVTLCQARFDPLRHREAPDMAVAAAPALLHARGMRVSLCHMQGVFLAVASA